MKFPAKINYTLKEKRTMNCLKPKIQKKIFSVI